VITPHLPMPLAGAPPGRSTARATGPSAALIRPSCLRKCAARASEGPAPSSPPPSGGPARVAAAALAALCVAATPQPAPPVTNEQLLYLEAWRAVDRAYVDKKFNGQNWFKIREDALKKEKLGSREETYAAIKALLASLGDPFTRFLVPEQYSALRRTTAGAVTGVGVEVSFATDRGTASPLVVIAPAPGGPAERAGIKPGDEILEIDGAATADMSLYAAGGLLQGPEGSAITLKIKPCAGGAAKDLKLTRAPILINSVDSALCSTSGRLAPDAPNTSKLGYIRVATFSKSTAEKVRAALEELRAGGADRLVLDVRNNGGGLFPAGVEVGRMLINKGDIVLIADSNGVRDIYEADGHPIDATTPLTVLVNRGTASASEVLAGALKDSGRAVLAGEPTFGKGLIQTVIELSDGSAVAVTVAKYQTPAGVDINKVGIQPQIVLDAETLAEVPFGGEAFCKYAASAETAPKLFG
jgi:carboxyl-terminal processing protease